MLLITALCTVMFGAEVAPPVSAWEAVEAAEVARLPEYFTKADELDPALVLIYAMPVARVNGQVILAGEVLQRYSDYLAQVSQRVSAEEFSRTVQDIIKRDLPGHVTAVALLAMTVEELSEADLAALRCQVELIWRKELRRLAKELGSREDQLPIATTLDAVKESFFRQAMCRGYLEIKMNALVLPENLDLQDEEVRTAHEKLRGAVVKATLREARSRAKIDTAYTIDWETLR